MMMDWISEYIFTQWMGWTLLVIYSVTILGIVAVVISENRNPVKSLAWVTVLLVVPLLGLAFYIVFGRNIQSKRIISRRNMRRLRRLGSVDRKEMPHAELSALSARQVTLAKSLCHANYYEDNEIEIFSDGTDKFEALLSDISRAKKYINLQYYILEGDKIGCRVMEALMERARAGVTVRVIYDHVGSFKLPKRWLKRLKQAGVEAYPFFKVFFPPFGTRINWRNHRKLAVIDGRVGYIGGMNVADRYVDGGKKFDHWVDLHFRVVGPVVAALQQAFAIDWNFMGQPLIEDSVPEKDQNEKRQQKGDYEDVCGMQLVTGGPTNQWMNLTMMFQQAISDATTCIYIMTPYFLPSESLLQSLQIAALSKIDVRVMLPRKSDSDMLRWASFSYLQECMQAGIKFYLYEGGMFHSKAIVIDDDYATVGSTNFDFRSFEHNFEANMMVYSRDFNERLKNLFLDQQRHCTRVTPAQWRKRPIRERVLESVMRLLAPIL